MKIKFIRAAIAASVIACGCQAVSAQDFFDTSLPENVFDFGVRVGLNTSVNTTSDKAGFNIYNHNSWGLGFDAGFVVNINIREYLSLQPGFFFESRSGDYTYISDHFTADGVPNWAVRTGHTRRYAFDIPVLASFHFNLGENVRWNVEVGPYMSFNLKTTDKTTYFESEDVPELNLKHKAVDVGFKMGTGFTINRRYEVMAHYLAGCNDAWKDPLMGGRNKAWTFTAGYNF